MEQHPVIKVFARFNPLSPNTIREFEDIISYGHFRKNTTLLEIGKKAKSLFYIQKGLARAYYYHEGKEVTDYFALDGQFIGAVPSLMYGGPSEKAIHLIEASDIYYFTAYDFEECCGRNHDLERAARRIMGMAILDEQERIMSLRFYSMKERYELLGRKYPGIMNRCPLHYIASYLGTTQVSISRIRAGTQ